MSKPTVRTARCENIIEHSDLSASPCFGLLRFEPDQTQARCDTCSAWCGSEVANYISDLQAILFEAFGDDSDRILRFTDLDQVPVGSSGYLSAYGENPVSVSRVAKGWLRDHGHYLRLDPQKKYIFTSHSGPANIAKLAQRLEQALVPDHHLLTRFEVVSESEPGNWEMSEPDAHWTTLANPQVLGYTLDERELAQLSFEIEAVGTLGESDAYSDLDAAVEKLAKEAAESFRTKMAQNNTELFKLQAQFFKEPEVQTGNKDAV